jgi:L-asparaginase/Glu-tRNA(Gln) amidotransferase subunit D
LRKEVLAIMERNKNVVVALVAFSVFGFALMMPPVIAQQVPVIPGDVPESLDEEVTIESHSIIHMADHIASAGYGVYAQKPARAEYVTETSELVADQIDSITLRLKRVGTINGTAEIGVLNEDLSVRKLFGTLDVSALTTTYTDYQFTLSGGELYTVESGDRIGIKYEGGSSIGNTTNWVSVMLDLDPAEPFDRANSYLQYYHQASWQHSPERDMYMILEQTHGDDDGTGGLPKIMFVTTGGTIANILFPNGTDGRIQIPDVMANIRERYPQPDVAAVLDSIDPTFSEVTRVGSGSFNLQEFLTIAWEAQKALDGDFDAVIVTQGTVSSEDTCYFLNLLVNTKKPIIVTNSQRQHMSIGNDGDMNLLNAILVATHPESREKGALLVEGAKIMSCREVLKYSDRPGAFLAGATGALGWLPGGELDENTFDRIVYYREPTRKHTFTSEFSIKDLVNDDGTFKPLPRVEVLASFYDARPDMVEAFVSLGVEGIVIQGAAPSGGPFAAQRPALVELANSGMPIVQTSRNAGAYEVRVQPSDGPFIGGDNLPSHKARILLQLAMEKTEHLTGEDRRSEIQRLFNTH